MSVAGSVARQENSRGTYRNAMDGNAICQGTRRDGVSKNVSALRHIPGFDFVRKAFVGNDVQVGLVDCGDEDVVTIGRWIERFVITGLSDGRDRGASRVDQSKLRGSVIIEEIL